MRFSEIDPDTNSLNDASTIVEAACKATGFEYTGGALSDDKLSLVFEIDSDGKGNRYYDFAARLTKPAIMDGLSIEVLYD